MMNHNIIPIEYDILDHRNHRRKNHQHQSNAVEYERHVKFAEKLVSKSTSKILPLNQLSSTGNQQRNDIKTKISRPKSANLASRSEQPKPWTYYASCDDRDLLRMEQDALNSKKTYQDRFYTCPVLNDHNGRFEMKDKSVSRRERIIAKTNGPIVNNRVYEYKSMKEFSETFLNEKWFVGTAVIDDPPLRAKPSIKPNYKSSQAFQNSYHAEQNKKIINHQNKCLIPNG
jgi:hypothetical protein